MESNIYTETADRLLNLSSRYLSNELENPDSFLEELNRIEELPLLAELRGKTKDELSTDQFRFAQMLNYAKLAREDSTKALKFARKIGLID